MFKTFFGIDEFVDDGHSMCFFLGVVPPASLPRARKLFFPNLSDAVLQAVKDFSPKMLEKGVSLVIDLAGYDENKKYVDAIQRHLAFLYAKYIVFPCKSFTIPDTMGVRKEDSEISIVREWVKAKNIPLYLKYPLCDVLKGLNLDIPVLVLLPGPSLASIGPKLKDLRKKCIIVCVARSLSFCSEHDCLPDFVVQLDTDIKMKHLFSKEQRFPTTFLVTLSPANISEIFGSFAGVFFKDSFNLEIIKNSYRLRESWLSCSISCLGMAEAFNSSKVYIAGGDHSWNFASETNFPYINDCEESGEVKFVGPARVENKFPSSDMSSDDDSFDAFEMPDVNGNCVRTYFHYYAIAEELNSIALEYRANGVECMRLSPSGILDSEAFPVVEIDTVMQFPDIDRTSLLDELTRINVQNNEIDFNFLEDVNFNLLRYVEQNSAFLSLKLNQSDFRDIINPPCIRNTSDSDKVYAELSSHPFVKSIQQSSKSRKLQILQRDWDAICYAIEVSKAWASSLKKGLAYLRFHKNIEKGENIFFFHVDEDPRKDLSNLYKLVQKEKVIFRRIVMNGLNTGQIADGENAAYLNVFACPQYSICIFSSKVVEEFEYILNLSLRLNYLTMDELREYYPEFI